MSSSSGELYVDRDKIFPRAVSGWFARLRVTAVVALLGMYYMFCWIEIGGQQLVLFDLPARQFHVFGLTFLPQDFLFVTLLMVLMALSLFFFTAIAGRLFCGYSCPQTVWTEVFMWIERKVEGDRPKQLRLDKAPWTREKKLRKGTKHALWLGLALWTGFTFVGYFSPIRELGPRVLSLDLGGWETFWILFYGLAAYGNAGWMREQVCLYMCPYARFQSAMFDRETLIISYDKERGEPRGSRARGVIPDQVGLGDCVSCTMCVQVCPTGIDIRDGLQYECIACAACIDVCDTVMDKVGYEKGLIRYTTQAALEGQPSRVLRPRTAIYATVLVLLAVGLAAAVATRAPLRLDVLRDRQALYRETGVGMIENAYVLKVVNTSDVTHDLRFSAVGLDGVRIVGTPPTLRVAPAANAETTLVLEADPYDLEKTVNDVTIVLTSTDDADVRIETETRFIGPSTR